jgi:two-component system response regulator/two-component system chemotaxis response regulator CheY
MEFKIRRTYMKKILIVDDQASMAMVLADILEEGNFQVFTAVNGELGVKKAKELKPDLIVMDIMMPVKDGLTAIRELRELDEFKKIPIFILSAKGGSHDANVVKELDIKGFVHKPFSPGQILDEIKAALV